MFFGLYNNALDASSLQCPHFLTVNVPWQSWHRWLIYTVEIVVENGCLYTKMEKVMYSCVQAIALWYKLLMWFLEGLGYEVSEMD
jgi:hypothetical protein